MNQISYCLFYSVSVQQPTDLSSGQIAGIIVGVMLALVVVCGILIYLKHYSGNTLFNFRRMRDRPGFDNACYDKSNEEVSINNESTYVNGNVSKVANGNGVNLNFTDFHEDDS